MDAQGTQWICTDRNCGWSLLHTHITEENKFPRCVCGSPMRRSLVSPVFTYLDFLRTTDQREADAELERKQK